MNSKWVAIAAAIAVLVLALLFLRYAVTQAERLSKLELENRELREKIARLTATVSVPAAAGAPAKQEEARRGPADVLKQHSPAAGPSLEDYSLTQTKEQLAAARSTISELEHHLAQTRETVEKLNEQTEQLKAAGEESRETLAANVRVVEAMQAELQSKETRLSQLQAESKRLIEQSRTVSDRLSRFGQANKELEDINRRRDNYLTNIQRRYRELTDLFRTMSMRIDRPSETNPAQPVELSRIQTAISMAEEDLRQLQTLNAAAQRLRPRLP